MDKFKLEQYLNIIKLLKDETFINDKIVHLEKDNYSITNLGSSYHKIKQILLLAKSMNIQRLEIDKKDFTFYEISDNQYKLISKIFRCTKPKPTDKYTLMKLYTSMLRNIGGSDIIISICGTTRASRKMEYKINTNLIHHMIELNKFKNPYLKQYDINILNNLKIEIPVMPVINVDENASLNTLDKDIIFDDDD